MHCVQGAFLFQCKAVPICWGNSTAFQSASAVAARMQELVVACRDPAKDAFHGIVCGLYSVCYQIMIADAAGRACARLPAGTALAPEDRWGSLSAISAAVHDDLPRSSSKRDTPFASAQRCSCTSSCSHSISDTANNSLAHPQMIEYAYMLVACHLPFTRVHKQLDQLGL